MRRVSILILCAALPLSACHNQSGNDNQVVDTTLNDAVASPQQASQTMNVDENLTVSSPEAPEARSSQDERQAQRGSMDSDDDTAGGTLTSEHNERGAASARGDIRTLFSADDYPAAAQAAGAEGTVQAELTIGPDGRVVGCDVVRSTGNDSLDSATCSILRRRAVFIPARDSNGNAKTDTVTTPPITWKLEG